MVQFQAAIHQQANKNKYFASCFSSKNDSVNVMKPQEWQRNLSAVQNNEVKLVG